MAKKPDERYQSVEEFRVALWRAWKTVQLQRRATVIGTAIGIAGGFWQLIFR